MPRWVSLPAALLFAQLPALREAPAETAAINPALAKIIDGAKQGRAAADPLDAGLDFGRARSSSASPSIG